MTFWLMNIKSTSDSRLNRKSYFRVIFLGAIPQNPFSNVLVVCSWLSPRTNNQNHNNSRLRRELLKSIDMKIFFIIIFLLIGQALHPQKKNIAKIGVLSKYNLSHFNIKIKKATIYINNKKYIAKNKQIYFTKIQSHLIIHKLTQKSIQTRKILIQSISNFIVLIKRNNKIKQYIYTGRLNIFLQNKKISFILNIPVEKYIHSTALAELGPLLYFNIKKNSHKKWKKILISTMEIAVRSYYMTHRYRHRNQKYELCDLTHCMHFKGIVSKESSYTKGILWKNKKNEIIKTYFHSTCGGVLNHPADVWSGVFQNNYRIGSDSINNHLIHCSDSNHFNWMSKIKKSIISKLLNEKKTIHLKAIYKNKRISIIQYTNHQRQVKKIKIGLFLSIIGKNLGWNKIKSNLFIIKQQDDEFIFIGHGFGHGIGLCQWGAREMAFQGYTYQQILEFYYPLMP